MRLSASFSEMTARQGRADSSSLIALSLHDLGRILL